MRIQQVKISGFRPIPFCAQADFDADPVTITWDDDAFTVTFPTGFGAVDRDEIDWEDETPKLLSTMIGANSSGKSSVLYALDTFFGSSSKLPEEYFNEKALKDDDDNENHIIVEVTAVGRLNELKDWHKKNCCCVPVVSGNDKVTSYLCELTVAVAWTTKSRKRYIKCENGHYEKIGTNDYDKAFELFPQYRLIQADSKLGDEIDPQRRNTLMKDIFKAIQARSEKGNVNNDVLRQLSTRLEALGRLLQRSKDAGEENRNAEVGEEEQVDWQLIEDLERELSGGLGAVNPSASLRFDLYSNLPSVEDLFYKAVPLVTDGIECEPEKHGLGMQRSLILSTLKVWQKYVGSQEDDKDYFFAIEEPEIFLHPHAIRVMINILETIAGQDQVIFTTHSNEFANRVPLENITILRRNGTQSCAAKPDLSKVDPKDLVKVRRYMVEDRSDMLFARSVILVEGQSELFALPSFARKLGYTLDKSGISIVCTNGKGNFKVYHQILDAFNVPHILFGDGDGEIQKHLAKYEHFMTGPDTIFLLDEDFEYLIVTVLSDDRVLEIVNICRERRGKTPALTMNDLQDAFRLEAVNLKSAWWNDLKDDINRDIAKQHRDNYKQRKEDLQNLLLQIAQEVVKNNHLVQTALEKRKAKKLKKQGKPLLGRVLGDELTKEEIEQMGILIDSLDKALELAQNQ